MTKERVSLLLSGILCFLISGCGDKIEPGTTALPSGPKVKALVAELRISEQPMVYEAVGTVQARTAGTLSSKVMGTVLKVHVREGDMVKKDDALVTLDDTEVTARMRQARAGLDEAKKAETAGKAALDSARAGAAQAATVYERTRKLFEGQAATQENLEAAEARNKEARASVSQAVAMLEAAQYRIKQSQAALDTVEVSLKDTIILAPYDGKVTEKMVDEGDLASPGTPLLSMERTTGYRVDLILPEAYIKEARIHQKVPVSIPAVSDEVFDGMIETIVPQADEKSRSFLLKVSLPGLESLRPGLFARVSVAVGKESVALIPKSAIVTVGQLTGVFVVKENNTARFRIIRTGRDFSDRMEVVTGLAEGERYVVSPTPQLVDGAVIE